MALVAKPTSAGVEQCQEEEHQVEGMQPRTSWRSSETFVTFAVAFAVFTDTMLYDIVIPFLPQLFSGRLGTPSDQIEQWTARCLEAFGVATLIFTWIAGLVADRQESKSTGFLCGLAIMPLATLFFFASTNPYLVILGRGLQGASTGIVWVSGIGFLVAQVDEANIGVCMGYVTLGLTLGELSGPLLGGSLYDTVGHWAVFGVVEVLITVDIMLRLLIKETTKGSKNWKEAEEDEVLETSPLLARSLPVADHGIVEDNASTFVSSNHTASSDSEANDSDYDPYLIKKDHGDDEAKLLIRAVAWDFVNSIFCVLVASILRCGMEASIPLFVLRHYGWSASAGGAAMTALLLPNVFGPALGKLTGLHGPRWYGIGSFIVSGIGTATLSLLTRDDATTQILFIINISIIGVGLTVGMLTHQNAIYIVSSRVDDLQDRAKASGVQLSRFERFITSGMMLSGISSAWPSGLLIGPACVSVIHFTTNEEWMHVCLFWSALSFVTAAYSLFAWKKW